MQTYLYIHFRPSTTNLMQRNFTSTMLKFMHCLIGNCYTNYTSQITNYKILNDVEQKVVSTSSISDRGCQKSAILMQHSSLVCLHIGVTRILGADPVQRETVSLLAAQPSLHAAATNTQIRTRKYIPPIFTSLYSFWFNPEVRVCWLKSIAYNSTQVLRLQFNMIYTMKRIRREDVIEMGLE